MQFLRQLDVLNPNKHDVKKRIDVIGAGAVGSYIIWFLAKVGMKNIHVWDDDVVKEHNLPNQCFLLEHVDKAKVEAIADMVKRGAGIDIVQHQQRVDGSQELGPIVFLAVDSMSDPQHGRKKIWDDALRYNLKIKCLIEIRMGIDLGRIYMINPLRRSHVVNWERTLCSDDEAQTSACGAVSSIAPTAGMIADIAVWQLIKWLRDEEVESEILFSTRSFMITSQNF